MIIFGTIGLVIRHIGLSSSEAALLSSTVIKSSTIERADIDSMTITWLGHSSSLLQIHSLNVLIDPIIKEYASPVNSIGVKRFSDIPIEPDGIKCIIVLQ